MTPSPTIDLAISQTPSFIADKTFIEQIPYHYVEQLIKNDCLQDKWDLTNYSQELSSQFYLNEKDQLTSYLNNYNRKLNGFQVKYNKARHKWGRVFPSKSLGLTSFAKKTRNTLIKGIYYDFDLSNAQPQILRNICKSNNITHDIIEKYCNEREQIMNDIIQASSNKVNREHVKSLIIRLSFYGGFINWLKELKDDDNNSIDFAEPIIVRDYRSQVQEIANALKIDNLDLYKTMERCKKEKGGCNFMGSFLSTYLQEYELRIVEYVLKKICIETNICSTDVPNYFIATYEFDGLKLLISRVDAFGGVDALLKFMNDANREFGFDINWELKPISKYYEIEFIEPISLSDEDKKEREKRIKEQEREQKKEQKAEEKRQKFMNQRTDLLEKNKKIIANNDKEASEIIFKKIKDDIKYSNGILYYKHNHLWISNYDMIKSIIGNLITNSGIRKLNDYNQIVDYVQNRKNSINVLNLVLDIAITKFDNEWTKNMFSSSLGKILFTNGYYDFHKGLFFKFDNKHYDHSIIFIEQISHDFIPLCNDKDFIAEDYIASIKKRLFIDPFGDDVAEYYLLNIARGLAGDVMKRALFGIGDGNTGKSTISACIDNACGGYCGTFNANNIIMKKMTSGDEGQQLRWVMMLLSKRIIISNEIENDAVISGTMLKKLASGGLDKIVARGHSKNETEFNISFLPIIFANDIDKISPMDDAVVNRVRAIHYQKVYKENPDVNNPFELPIDYNFKNEIRTNEFKIGFMTLLMRSYKSFMDNKNVEIEPAEIKKAIISSFGVIQDYITKFQDDFEITNNEDDYVESSKITEWIKINKLNISMTKVGRDINKFCEVKKYQNVYNGYKKIDRKSKAVWFGIKQIIEEDDFQ
jgi:hypothetical protein